MPIVNNKPIEILNPLQAYQAGYLTYDEYILTEDWVRLKRDIRHSNRNVYISGVYRGVTDVRVPLHQVVEKFKKYVY